MKAAVTDGRLQITWNGTEDCSVRIADADDELSDDAVYQERQAAGTSAVFDHFVPEHTYNICFFIGSFDPETAVILPYRTPKADPLGKYSLQLAAMSINAVDAADPKIRTSIQGQPIRQVLAWMNDGGRACVLEFRLSHQRLNADRDVHYTLTIKAPNGAALSLGTNIEIIDYPGYSPLNNDDNMIDVVDEAIGLVAPEIEFKRYDGFSTGSTDNVKPELVVEALFKYMGLEYNESAIQIHRIDVYAADAKTGTFISLGDMGEVIL